MAQKLKIRIIAATGDTKEAVVPYKTGTYDLSHISFLKKRIYLGPDDGFELAQIGIDADRGYISVANVNELPLHNGRAFLELPLRSGNLTFEFTLID
ncbi:MAG: hypothetical protein K5694_00920 [Bacilli bacterium]|nr:hypothetical protein [Bacilli bacterium]